MSAAVGRTITIVRTNPATGAETREQARVLAANGGVVLDIGGRIEVLRDDGLPVRLSDAAETHFFRAFSSSSSSSSGAARGMKARLERAYLEVTGFASGACLMLVGHEGEEDTVAWAQRQSEEICKRLGALPLGTRPARRWYHGRFSTPYSRDPSKILTR